MDIYLSAMLLTVAFELPIVLPFLGKNHTLYNIIVIILVNLTTNFVLNQLYIRYLFPVLIGEIVVVIVETVCYWYLCDVKLKSSLIISSLANAFSYAIGLILYDRLYV